MARPWRLSITQKNFLTIRIHESDTPIKSGRPARLPDDLAQSCRYSPSPCHHLAAVGRKTTRTTEMPFAYWHLFLLLTGQHPKSNFNRSDKSGAEKRLFCFPQKFIAYLPSFCRTKTPIRSTWLSIEYSTSAICRPCRIGKGRYGGAVAALTGLFRERGRPRYRLVAATVAERTGWRLVILDRLARDVLDLAQLQRPPRRSNNLAATRRAYRRTSAADPLSPVSASRISALAPAGAQS